MRIPQLVNLPLDLPHILLRLLDGGAAVALVAPTGDVVVHLVKAARLGADLVARLAARLEVVGLVHELHAARLAGAVLLVALLPEVAPLPVAAAPAGAVEVAHFLSLGFVCFLVTLGVFSVLFLFLCPFFRLVRLVASVSSCCPRVPSLVVVVGQGLEHGRGGFDSGGRPSM